MSKENNKISNQCNEINNCKITKRRGDPVDVYVGSRIREKRVILGMSQEKLGSQLGISFQQVQKYEKGINRISSSRLHEIAEILKVHVSYFFQHYDDLSDVLKIEDKDLEKYILKTAGLFENIKDDKLRKKIFLGSKNVYDSVILARKCAGETNNEIETDGLNEPNDNNQQGEL